MDQIHLTRQSQCWMLVTLSQGLCPPSHCASASCPVTMVKDSGFFAMHMLGFKPCAHHNLLSALNTSLRLPSSLVQTPVGLWRSAGDFVISSLPWDLVTFAAAFVRKCLWIGDVPDVLNTSNVGDHWFISQSGVAVGDSDHTQSLEPQAFLGDT
jgi:hypothetical protein